MIEFTEYQQLLCCMNIADHARKVIEDAIQEIPLIGAFCSICNEYRTMTIRQSSGDWIDLRSEAVCTTCDSPARNRMLFETIMREATRVDSVSVNVLVFERLTPFYGYLAARFHDAIGVEYAGSDMKSGEFFQVDGFDVRHEDMQALSFPSLSFDIVIHSDVLEHVPDPIAGMNEIYRVLRPGGKCIFSCPIYSVPEHRQRAYLSKGALIFTDGECYHGDPIRNEGVPVFYEFGLKLIDDLNKCGFITKYTLDHSIQKAYFSNNNPWRAGHMWPLAVVCEKPA